MRVERVFAALLVCGLALALAACTAAVSPTAAPVSSATTTGAAAPADLSGTWALRVGRSGQVRLGSDITLHGPMTLKQTGSRISGSYVEQAGTSLHSGQTGEVSGEYSPPAVSMELTFTDGHAAHWRGTVSGDSMEGTLPADGSPGLFWPWQAQRAQAK